MKRTKIVATIGPASESVKTLREMIRTGMNVCRLNFSHGDYRWHSLAVKRIRQAAKLEKVNVAIMADIQGPRIRVANHKEITLKKNEKVFLTDETSLHLGGHKKEIILDWQRFYVHVRKGDRIFIEDGIIDLEVVEKKKNGCVARVLQEGVVAPRKGVNIPCTSSHLGFLTEKDVRDLEFILSQNVEYIAVSFVGSRRDLVGLRELMKNWERKEKRREMIKRARKPKFSKKRVKVEIKIELPLIVSKIERKEAIRNLDEIIEQSDAIMVARGDLAIEMPQQKVALFQKDIISKCLKKKKPVIVATQMMNSMIESPRPTRAEIADVTNAVIDHADAVMLSGETANGRYPARVVETMTSIIEETEKSPYDDVILKTVNRFTRLLTRAKKSRKKTIGVKNLKEAIELASLRQDKVWIVVRCQDCPDKRRCSLVWGVH